PARARKAALAAPFTERVVSEAVQTASSFDSGATAPCGCLQLWRRREAMPALNGAAFRWETLLLGASRLRPSRARRLEPCQLAVAPQNTASGPSGLQLREDHFHRGVVPFVVRPGA